MRTCCATTATRLNHIAGKFKLAGCAECMPTGPTLRQSEKQMGMSLGSAFRWRHRFLEKVVSHQLGSI